MIEHKPNHYSVDHGDVTLWHSYYVNDTNVDFYYCPKTKSWFQDDIYEWQVTPIPETLLVISEGRDLDFLIKALEEFNRTASIILLNEDPFY